jgi:hypothetical protein
VDNILAMDAVFRKNMEAFLKSDDEDESCGSDGYSEDGSDDSDGAENKKQKSRGNFI